MLHYVAISYINIILLMPSHFWPSQLKFYCWFLHEGGVHCLPMWRILPLIINQPSAENDNTQNYWRSAPLGYKQLSWSGAELHFNFIIPWRKLAPSVRGCQGSSYSNYILSWIHQSLVVVMWPCLQDRQLLVSQFHLSNLIQQTKLGSPVVRLRSR